MPRCQTGARPPTATILTLLWDWKCCFNTYTTRSGGRWPVGLFGQVITGFNFSHISCLMQSSAWNAYPNGNAYRILSQGDNKTKTYHNYSKRICNVFDVNVLNRFRHNIYAHHLQCWCQLLFLIMAILTLLIKNRIIGFSFPGISRHWNGLKSLLWKTSILSTISLLWRQNGCDGVSNHQPRDCLLNRLFRRRSKKKLQSSASLAFENGIHLWPVNSPHKGPVTRKMFPFDDVIM